MSSGRTLYVTYNKSHLFKLSHGYFIGVEFGRMANDVTGNDVIARNGTYQRLYLVGLAYGSEGPSGTSVLNCVKKLVDTFSADFLAANSPNAKLDKPDDSEDKASATTAGDNGDEQ